MDVLIETEVGPQYPGMLRVQKANIPQLDDLQSQISNLRDMLIEGRLSTTSRIVGVSLGVPMVNLAHPEMVANEFVGQVATLADTGLAGKFPVNGNASTDHQRKKQMESDKRRQDHACKVCGNMPDADGNREHGKGCYVVDSDGGGSDFCDLETPC